MKTIYYLIFVGLILISLNSCDKNSDGLTLVTKTETISLTQNYANEIYYRLSDGLTTTVPRGNWDIAFSVSPREAAILTNATSGVVLKVYPQSGWDWATSKDTTGFL